jgi:hypothetical protein
MSETAKLYKDLHWLPETWRVEWTDDEGRIEIAIFCGPNARERAIRYADREHGRFEEISRSRYS